MKATYHDEKPYFIGEKSDWEVEYYMSDGASVINFEWENPAFTNPRLKFR